MADRFALLRKKLEEAVLEGPGITEAELRRRVAERREVPEDLRALIEAVHDRAHAITDAQIAEHRTKRSDEELFELIAAAAVGASRKRLEAGLAAIAGRKR